MIVKCIDRTMRSARSVVVWSCLLWSSMVLGRSVDVDGDGFLVTRNVLARCPAARFVAPCKCRGFQLMQFLICRDTSDLKFVQQILFSNFLKVLVPYLKIQDSHLPVLPSNAFVGVNIRKLDITNCELQNLEDSAFVGLEDTLVFLSIRGNPLTDVPTRSLSVLKELVTLDLSDNQLTEIRNDSFVGLDKLKYLALRFNKIHTINANAFLNLAQLMLSYNKLHSLQGQLRDLPNLKWLMISGNYLTSFKNEFNYLPELRLLVASANKIESIDSDLAPLKNLNSLSLAANKLKRLDERMFSKLLQLEDINLSRNEISEIGKNSFSRQSILRRLVLSDNRLTAINGIFQHLRALMSLNLSNNLISALGSGDLNALSALVELDVSFNHLTRLDKHSFQNLGPTLVKLVLSNNKINSLNESLSHLEIAREINIEYNNLTTLHAEDFPCSCNSMLSYLRLHGNPLKCSRNLKEALAELRKISTLSMYGEPDCSDVELGDEAVVKNKQPLEVEKIEEVFKEEIVEKVVEMEKMEEPVEEKVEEIVKVVSTTTAAPTSTKAPETPKTEALM